MPRLGKRIIKSFFGILICYLIHRLRGGGGIVFYSQLATLWCIQPYIKDSVKNGLQRTRGTLIGAAYGLLVILLCHRLFPVLSADEGLYALVVSIGVALVLYTTVVLKQKAASYFSAVVFLSIVVNHIQDINPVLFVWDRVLDTMIGIVVGVSVNIFRIPRRKRKDILFVSGVDDTLLNSKEEISPFSKVEINRMLDEGANFTVSTMRTPASVIEALSGINWRLPLIVMDGAALYDIVERRYIKTCPLDSARIAQLRDFFASINKNCYINTVVDEMLVICHGELQTDTERLMYSKLRKSVHRNLVQRDLSADGEVLYFMSFGEKALMDTVFEQLKALPCYDNLKILYYPSTDYPGQMYIKIYDRSATRDNMMQYLKEYTGLEKTLTFGSLEGRYDVVVHPKETDIVARTLERVYEPYFFVKD